MTPPAPTLDDLIAQVRGDAPGAEPLGLLAQASRTAHELEETGDALVGHFVEGCRAAGLSWSEISGALGVTKQAAHKRFSPGAAAFERFTPRAREALRAAAEEARRLGHPYVASEHLLIGLFDQAEGLAARVLGAAGLTRAAVEDRVVGETGRGSASEEGLARPYTAKAVEALRASVEEALRLGHNYVGTEHLLLALSRDRDDLAGRTLAALGAGYDDLKSRVGQVLADLVKRQQSVS